MTPIIGENSQFRRLPEGLAAHEQLVLDGIRQAFEIIDLSFRRVRDLALQISKDSTSKKEFSHSVWPTIFADTWTMLDACNRLATLLASLSVPKSTSVKLYYSLCKPVNDIRNAFQHADQELKKMPPTPPVWGVLQWCYLIDQSTMTLRIFSMASGTISDGQYPFLNPLGAKTDIPIGLFTLQAFGTSASLTDLHRAATAVAREMEKSLEAVFSGKPGTINDILMSVDLTPNAEPEAVQAG